MESTMAGDDDVEAQPTRQSRRETRGWRLGVIVAVQSVVVALCCAVSVYVYWLVEQQVTGKDDIYKQDHIYIEFNTYKAISPTDGTLIFATNESHKVDVQAGKIKIVCRGPYMLYMDVCFKKYDDVKAGNGTLELCVEGGKPRVQASFPLHGTEQVCRRLHGTVYLKENEIITMHFNSTGKDLKIVNLTLGLSYLMGTRCL